MPDTKVARRYAHSLFSIALEGKVVRAVEEDLETIVGLLETNAKFRSIILTPTVTRSEKIGFLEQLFADRATAITLQALRLILQKGRESEIPAIYACFCELRRESDGVMYAEVISAITLEDGQKDRLIEKFEKALNKRIEATFTVDSSVIGGIKVAYQNNVLDGTLKGSLAKLCEHLRYDLLKQA